jgi:hypothetical protein
VPATVKAGERGVDFSFAKPPPHRLLELGYTFVVGYISIPPATAAKNISQAECEAYLAAGLKVLLVWEMSATRPNLGAPAGALDGRNASFQAAIRGYPEDVPILAAVDTNSVPTNIAAHADYLEAFADNCGPYPIGVYGDTDILTRCNGLWRIGWVPNAWSWSGSSRANAEAKARALGAHVLQRTGFHIDGLWAVDPNDVIADFPAWGTVTEPPPEPPTDIAETEETVRIKVQNTPGGAPDVWFERVGMDLQTVSSGHLFAKMPGAKADESDIAMITVQEMIWEIEATRYTYGVLTDAQASRLGPDFVQLWNANRDPGPSSGGGSGDGSFIVQMTGTAIPGVIP